MRRLGLILVGLVAALIGIALLSLVPLTQTSLGIRLADRISRPIVEQQIRDQFGSDIAYAPLAGRLPNQIIVRDLELSARGEVWAKADRFILRWNAWDLLRRRVRIHEMVLVDGALYALPPDVAKPPSTEEPASGEAALLPSIDLDSLVITDFVLGEALLGRRYSVSLFGAGAYDDPGAAVSIELQTAGATDRATLDLTFDGDEIAADVVLLSEEDGLISQLIGAEARTELVAYASGPLNLLTARIAATAGLYGQANAQIAGSMEQRDRLAGSLAFRPGDFLPPEALAALGDEVRLTMSGLWTEGGVDLTIESLTGAFGEIAGTVDLAIADERAADVSLSGTIHPAVLEPYGAEALGGPLNLSAQAQESVEGYSYAGSLSAGLARLTLREGRTDDAALFAGDVELQVGAISLGDPRIDPILQEGTDVRAGVRYSDDGTVSVERLKATLGTLIGRRITAEGSASYAVEAGRIAADLTLRAGPQALSLLLGQGTFASPLSVKLDASGTAEALGVVADAQLPSGQVEGTDVGAGRLQANISGLPRSPGGKVRLTSTDQSYSGAADFRMDEQTLEISQLMFSAGGLSAEGRGRLNLDTREAQAMLAIDARRDTTLITGQTIGGTLNLDARTSADLDRVDISLSGRELTFDGNEIGRLSLTAMGAQSAIIYDFSARDVTASTLFFNRAESQGTVDLAEGQKVSIASLLLVLPGEDQTLSLVDTTTVSWAEGIAIAPTRINYLGQTNLDLSAHLAPTRWRATLNTAGLPVPNSEVLADLDLDLDTDRVEMASFSFAARANAHDTDYALSGTGTWNGRLASAMANVLRGSDEVLGTIEAAVPFRLMRGESLSITVPEEQLFVNLQYKDRLEPIFAFLPVQGQPLTGHVRADVTVGGTPSAPLAEGEIMLADARFEDSTVGLTLSKLNGGVVFDVTPSGARGEVNITGAGASGREQSVKLNGTVIRKAQESFVDLTLALDRAQLANNPELELRVSSNLRLTGPFDDLLLAGPITLDELDLTIPEIGAGDDVPTFAPVNVVRVDGPELEQVEELTGGEDIPVDIRLDLRVRADDAIFIRGRGLTSEWNADLQVLGSALAPRIGGTVGLEEGQLSLAGRTFDLTTGSIGFQRTREIDPIIDLEAQTEAGEGTDTVTAIVRVNGPASNPAISLRSNPALPEEDVLALILFGRPAQDLGASEALQLAQAAATLSGTLGSGPGITGSLRSGLGLDRLSFDPTARAVEVGKYVSEDIYVSARQSLTQAGTIISIVYELSRFISLETTLQPNGAQTIGASYRRDY